MSLALLGILQIHQLDQIPHRICCPCGFTRPFNPFGDPKEDPYRIEGKEAGDDDAAPASPSQMEMDRVRSERSREGIGRNKAEIP